MPCLVIAFLVDNACVREHVANCHKHMHRNLSLAGKVSCIWVFYKLAQSMAVHCIAVQDNAINAYVLSVVESSLYRLDVVIGAVDVS